MIAEKTSGWLDSIPCQLKIYWHPGPATDQLTECEMRSHDYYYSKLMI